MPRGRINGRSVPRKTSRSKPESTPVMRFSNRDTKRFMALSLVEGLVLQPPSYREDDAVSYIG